MRLAGNRKELECAGACTGCWERFVLVEGERGEEEVEVEDVFVFWISFCRSDFLGSLILKSLLVKISFFSLYSWCSSLFIPVSHWTTSWKTDRLERDLRPRSTRREIRTKLLRCLFVSPEHQPRAVNLRTYA